MSGCAIIGAIAGGFLGVVTAMLSVASCNLGNSSGSFCTFQRSVEPGCIILAALLGAGIGDLCVGGFINWSDEKKKRQERTDKEASSQAFWRQRVNDQGDED
jgi:hypothetical protein